MSEDILDCLTAISNHEGNKWGSKTMTGAVGLLCAISSSTFIFQVNRCMFQYTVGLSKLPQGSTQDVLRAYEEVTLVKDIATGIRQIADAEYSDIYKK